MENQKEKNNLKKLYLIEEISKYKSSYILNLAEKDNKDFKLFSIGYDPKKKSIFHWQYEKQNIYFRKSGDCK